MSSENVVDTIYTSWNVVEMLHGQNILVPIFLKKRVVLTLHSEKCVVHTKREKILQTDF